MLTDLSKSGSIVDSYRGYDATIIGAGAAGITLALKLSAEGKKSHLSKLEDLSTAKNPNESTVQKQLATHILSLMLHVLDTSEARQIIGLVGVEPLNLKTLIVDT